MSNCKKKTTQSSTSSQQLVHFKKNWNCLLLIFVVNFSTYPNVWSSIKDTNIKYIQFIEMLVDNFKERFDDFVLREQLLLFIQNSFSRTIIAEFLMEAKLTFK